MRHANARRDTSETLLTAAILALVLSTKMTSGNPSAKPVQMAQQAPRTPMLVEILGVRRVHATVLLLLRMR
jgi:hypothetical protein